MKQEPILSFFLLTAIPTLLDIGSLTKEQALMHMTLQGVAMMGHLLTVQLGQQILKREIMLWSLMERILMWKCQTLFPLIKFLTQSVYGRKGIIAKTLLGIWAPVLVFL
jgi:hypothetical protein